MIDIEKCWIGQAVIRACQAAKTALRFSYALDDSLIEKVKAIAKNVYKAKDVEFSVRMTFL
jgi:formyltetrahydrofolate synthetase